MRRLGFLFLPFVHAGLVLIRHLRGGWRGPRNQHLRKCSIQLKDVRHATTALMQSGAALQAQVSTAGEQVSLQRVVILRSCTTAAGVWHCSHPCNQGLPGSYNPNLARTISCPLHTSTQWRHGGGPYLYTVAARLEPAIRDIGKNATEMIACRKTMKNDEAQNARSDFEMATIQKSDVYWV